MISGRTLAVIVAHLYGYPCDLMAVADRARTGGAMLIEDAAQAFGAKVHGRLAGTLGDAGMFSFGMSKVLWSAGGGVIAISNPDLTRRVALSLSQALPPTGWSQMADAFKMALLAALLRSHHLGPLDAVWSSQMRGKGDCDDFRAAALSETHAAVACSLLRRLTEIAAVRASNANYFSTHLSQYPGLVLPLVAAGSEPAFLRYPIVIDDIARKRDLLTRLREAGINASEMYARDSYDGVLALASRRVDCPRSEYLLDRMLNLPTHSFVTARDLTRTVEVFGSVLGGFKHF